MIHSHRRPIILMVAIVLAAILAGLAVGFAGSARATDYDDQIDSYQDQIDKANEDLSDTKADEEAAAKRAEELDAALEDTDAKIVEAAKNLDALEAEVPGLEKAVEEAQAAVDAAIVEQGIVADKLLAAQARDEAITAQIADDQAKTEQLKALVAAIARESYKGGSAQAGLGIVFGATDEDEFVNEFTAQESAARVQASTLAELDEIAAVNRNRGVRQEAVRDYIVELKQRADALVIERKEKEAAAVAAKEELDAKLAEAQELKGYLEDQRETYQEQQAENQRLRDDLESQVKSLYEAKKKAEEGKSAAERAKDKAEGSSGSSGSSSGGASASGYFDYPTANVYITSSYGMRFHPVLHYWRLHAGTDFRAYCGTPIYASAPGTVEWAKRVGGFGNQVMLDHGKVGGDYVMTSYNHLSKFSVSSGQSVKRGQLLGYSGTTGNSTACHLHFEMYVNGSTVNPMSVL